MSRLPHTLHLVVANPQALAYGCHPTHVFDRIGGTIGSSHGKEHGAHWRLIDAGARVAPVHAEILILDGTYCLVDRSGVTGLNDDPEPMGRGRIVRLSEDDVIRIGPYRIAVQLAADLYLDRADQPLRHQGLLDILGQGVSHFDLLPPATRSSAHGYGRFPAPPTPAGDADELDPLRALDAKQSGAGAADLAALLDPTHYGLSSRQDTQADLAQTAAEAVSSAGLSAHATASLDDILHTPQGTPPVHAEMRALYLGWVIVALVASGCTTSKKVWQVLKDPNVPVGTWRDQPSQVALSLVAASDMNPPLYPPAETAPADPDLPYSVNLSGDDIGDLVRQLKVALQQAEAELHGTPEAEIRTDLTEVRIEPAEAAVLSNVIPDDGVPRQLGQYREGTPDDAPLVHPSPVPHASPLAVTVLQLKDDGRFLGAEFDALGADPEKALGNTYLDHDDFVLQSGQYKFVPFFPVQAHTRYIAVVASYQDLDARVWKAIARIEPNGATYPLLVRFDRRGVTLQHEN